MFNSLEEIAKQVASCKTCRLHQGRTNTVPGEGQGNAKVMFIGEGPGYYEDQQGRPFVGQAGKLLSQLLKGISLKREEVFIGNVVKCRPPGNRDPLPDEIDSCKEYLEAQIKIINPKLIVPLGRFAMNFFLPEAKISRDHGKLKEVDGIMILPVYHPAAALRKEQVKLELWEDFKKILKVLEKIEKKEIKAEGEKRKGKQLNLFSVNKSRLCSKH